MVIRVLCQAVPCVFKINKARGPSSPHHYHYHHQFPWGGKEANVSISAVSQGYFVVTSCLELIVLLSARSSAMASLIGVVTRIGEPPEPICTPSGVSVVLVLASL